MKYTCLFLGSERLLEVVNLLRSNLPSTVPPIEAYIDIPLVSTLLEQNLSLLILKKSINYHVIHYLGLVDNYDEVMAGWFHIRADPDIEDESGLQVRRVQDCLSHGRTSINT